MGLSRVTKLIGLDFQTIAAILDDLRNFEELHEVEANGYQELIISMVRQTRDFLGESESGHPWGSYLAVDETSRKIVGICSFKSPPTNEGVVEIAYFTFPKYEGRGYATSMAKNLIAMAVSEPGISRVVAHTLPERNASNRILEKLGMSFAGEATDPEDGQVWRWEYDNQG
jgi:ribosomal-protein-alanine N-acetyltransferase